MNEDTKMKLLEQTNSPDDIKRMSIEQLNALAREIRQVIIKTVSQTGGHVATNLGVVELTLALHYCFDFKKDRLLWDVGHQCYVHKLITGRYKQFAKLRQKDGLSGFPAPDESPYDLFSVGHAGTAIATALGLAYGDMLTKKNTRIVSLVGDASIVNGLSFEALNNAGLLKRQFLIVLNDNSMAIDVTQGAFAKYLNKLRFTHAYEDIKRKAHDLLDHLPLGKSMLESLNMLKQGVKTAISHGQIFEQLGITYLGPIDGHDLSMLIRAFKVVRDAPYPVLLHVQTEKGKGSKFASAEPTKFHSPSGYELNGDYAQIKPGAKTFTSVFGETILELAEKDKKIVAITAAMPDGTGLVEFKKRFPDRYFDVGIAESAAVDLAAGLAKSGLKPVVAIYSTFLQRAFDQIWQEVVLQRLPVIFCIDRAGLVGSDGAVHHGFCELAFLRTMPDIICCAPADEYELKSAIEFAVSCNKPIALRYPRDVVPEPVAPLSPFEFAKARIIKEGKDVVFLVYGALVNNAVRASELLEKQNIGAGVISARFAKPLDEELIRSLLKSEKLIVIIEDHSKAGGFGSAVFEFANNNNLPINSVIHLGLPVNELIPHASRAEQLERVGLDSQSISQTVAKQLAKRNSKQSGCKSEQHTDLRKSEIRNITLINEQHKTCNTLRIIS